MVQRIKSTWRLAKGTWELLSDIINDIVTIKSPYRKWLAISFAFLMVGLIIIAYNQTKVKPVFS